MEQEYLSRPRFSAVVKIISTPNPRIALSPKTVITDTVQYLNSLLLCQREALPILASRWVGKVDPVPKKGGLLYLLLFYGGKSCL